MENCCNPPTGFKEQERVLKALANATRLCMIDRLSRGECTAGELTQLTGLDQSTVSKHLAILRAHRIVDSRREGSGVVYELLTPCVTQFFTCANVVLTQRAD